MVATGKSTGKKGGMAEKKQGARPEARKTEEPAPKAEAKIRQTSSIKADVYSTDGKKLKSVNLPRVFETDYRPDIIQRAVVSEQSEKRQPRGSDLLAGLRTSAEYFGRRRDAYRMTINKGMSRLPRVKTPGGGLGAVKRIPSSRGGRRAHPPKLSKAYAKKINMREWLYALRSAISSTADSKLAKAAGRNHQTELALPLVVDEKFETLETTKDILKFLDSMHLDKELKRVTKKVRAGRGKRRGRRYKIPKSALIVVSDECSAMAATRNVPGVDAITVDELTVEMLAPGGYAGRLTIWTEPAINKLDELYLNT